ncbi:uncharacterized protein LOC143589900 [Bidens hawaiensis]|uniref:uncharacterized protein LOC143589900 n=1 Tax=Bidens hawaiensis TaxID=980011 RepID=UPI00404ACDA3
MALNLTLFIGAGLVGSVLAKEGLMSTFHGLCSGTSKALKILTNDEKSTSNPKPLNDSLLAQINMLRQELQLIASNRSVTVITSTGGTNKYGIIIIVAAAGYGYVWWKGWKFPDMMFATRRSLSDATKSVAKELDTVNSSLAATKRHISSRIDRVDCNLDEVAEITTSTKEEVSALRGKAQLFTEDVQSIHNKVYTLVRGSYPAFVTLTMRDETNLGVGRLIHTAILMENQGNLSTASRAALESPQTVMLGTKGTHEQEIKAIKNTRILRGSVAVYNLRPRGN